MKDELNIAAILKDKPKGTKLWSPIIGKCSLFDTTDYVEPIQVITNNSVCFFFGNDGRYIKEGEICLFPSKEMQDWSKFAWKKGDVLSCGNHNFCIFNGWANNDYTHFIAKYPLKLDTDILYSDDVKEYLIWFKVTNELDIKSYISKLEQIKQGKLNLETLEIEKPKSEFKDGDIVTIEDTEYKAIIIYKSNGDRMFHGYALIDNAYKELRIDRIVNALGRCIRLATEEEKQKLFSALEKEGKRWNPDTKTIEDLPKKYEFKPFDKVLVHYYGNVWQIGLFIKMTEYKESPKPYIVLDMLNCKTDNFAYCIPYNEKTKHLLGTTDEWKGGEG